MTHEHGRRNHQRPEGQNHCNAGVAGRNPEDIKDDDPLVGGETGIDSIDVLELVMMIEKDYGVKIDSKELGAKVFASVAHWRPSFSRSEPPEPDSCRGWKRP